ncbi:MAG TPA: hypothetical protein VJR48_07050, partial [Ktedonobacterales bacterium]|nr:hypothetical protein [Ktedonobacterales bacterium]
GLFTIAGGLYSMAATWYFVGKTHQPVDLAALAIGLAACAVGVLFLLLSRWLDPENGPIRSYRRRPRKSRTHA